MPIFESIFEGLNGADVRYVVVGGLATVLHGYARLTVDVDLIVDLAPDEARKTIGALGAMGFRPRVPVAAEDFANPTMRATWIREKHMRVFPMGDAVNPMRQVDLFVETPIEFESLWSRADIVQLDRTTVRVASIDDLITLKRLAGIPQDLTDIEALEAIARKRKG